MELLYLRKSQADSPNESVEEVLEKHEFQLQEFAEQELGHRISEECIYREVVSGETIEARVEVKKVLKLIESPDVDAVLVIEPQRLGRGDLEDCGRLVNSFRYTNTKIITPTKTYDLQDKYDRKFFEMELQRGADYLEYYKEIQARGRLASVKRGNYIGSIPPYGYDKVWGRDENGRKYPTLAENPQESPAVRMAFDLHVNHNLGFTKIAYALEEAGFKPRNSEHWSPPFIKDMLENPVYIGKLRWNRRKVKKIFENGQIKATRPKQKENAYELFDGKHAPLISEELYYASMAKAGRNIRNKATVRVRNPFSGLLYCQCGRAMTYHSYKKNGKERSEPRLLCDNQNYCHTSSCLYTDIEERVVALLRATIDDFKIEVENFDNNKAEIISSTIQGLEKKLEKLKSKELNLWEKYSEEGMPTEIFNQLIKKVENDKNKTQDALIKAKYQLPDKSVYEKQLITFQSALDALLDKSTPAEKKNALLKACIERITYNRPKATRIRKDGVTKLSPGSQWTQPEIQLDVQLRL